MAASSTDRSAARSPRPLGRSLIRWHLSNIDNSAADEDRARLQRHLWRATVVVLTALFVACTSQGSLPENTPTFLGPHSRAMLNEVSRKTDSNQLLKEALALGLSYSAGQVGLEDVPGQDLALSGPSG